MRGARGRGGGRVAPRAARRRASAQVLEPPAARLSFRPQAPAGRRSFYADDTEERRRARRGVQRQRPGHLPARRDQRRHPLPAAATPDRIRLGLVGRILRRHASWCSRRSGSPSPPARTSASTSRSPPCRRRRRTWSRPEGARHPEGERARDRARDRLRPPRRRRGEPSLALRHADADPRRSRGRRRSRCSRSRATSTCRSTAPGRPRRHDRPDQLGVLALRPEGDAPDGQAPDRPARSTT